jgi:hypothetical protein
MTSQLVEHVMRDLVNCRMAAAHQTRVEERVSTLGRMAGPLSFGEVTFSLVGTESLVKPWLWFHAAPKKWACAFAEKPFLQG